MRLLSFIQYFFDLWKTNNCILKRKIITFTKFTSFSLFQESSFYIYVDFVLPAVLVVIRQIAYHSTVLINVLEFPLQMVVLDLSSHSKLHVPCKRFEIGLPAVLGDIIILFYSLGWTMLPHQNILWLFWATPAKNIGQ